MMVYTPLEVTPFSRSCKQLFVGSIRNSVRKLKVDQKESERVCLPYHVFQSQLLDKRFL